ncbi:MAG: nucleoside hydrolase [Roseiarcus sp.]|jgi:inosine-uridine nucleoside N-ribohydrolase
MPAKPTPVIIDVDTGIDDAFGLLYACASPQARIVGVSTVVGNVDLSQATRNTRAVLALAGRPDIPVWPGCASPLLHTSEDGRIVHGPSGLGYAVLPDPPRAGDAPNAIDAIVAQAHAAKGELVLVATGPLTNIAAALMREPALPRLVERLVLMGGAYREAGNVTPAAEFNVWHDPEAARMVFRAFSGEGAAPLVAVGLDVTRKTLLFPEDLAALAKRCAGLVRAPALLRFLDDATRYYFDFMEKSYGARVFTMHDPLAIAAAIDPSLVATQRVAVDVETAGALTCGMTVADWRGVWKRPANAHVAIAVEATRFIAAFLDAMERLARG